MTDQDQRIVDMVIENGVVVPVTGPDNVIYDGAVAVDHDRIVGVGSRVEVKKKFAGKKVIDAWGKAVIPGLINAHCHFLQNFLKGSKDDLPLVEWIEQVSFPRIKLAVQDYLHNKPELQYYASLHGCIEALKSGNTTTVNMEWATPPETIGVYEKTGARVMHALTFTDNDQWTPPEAILSNEEIFGLADRLIERCKESQDHRVTFCYGVACPNSCSTELIRTVRQEADRHGARVHVHLAETNFEMNNIKNKFGKTPTAYLADTGLLGPDAFAAHGIWLTDEDIGILRETGTSIVHNPECNMKIASGVAPIAKMLKAGVNVALGTDSCATNDNTDLFEAMRLAVMLQRVYNLDAMCVSSYQGLEMATRGGAEAIGMGNELGSLEIGKLADIVLVDLTAVNMRPVNNALNNLVYCTNSSNVDTVIVNGEVVVEKGRLVTVDEEEALDQAEGYAGKRFQEAGLNVPPYFNLARR